MSLVKYVARVLEVHWYSGYISPVNHVDFLTSPGARIENLREMWRIEYGEERRGCDILVVAGLNNMKD